jgi:glycerophosphoryl diester phosphodiesterase
VRNCERVPRDPGAWLDRQPGLHAVCCDQRVLGAALVAACRERGVRVFAYTCNDAATLRRLSRLGIDALLTDRPAWLAARFGRPGRR